MGKIVIIGDVHDYQERLDSTLELLRDTAAELALLVGDVGLDPPWSEPARHRHRGPHDDSVRRVIDRVRQACDCPVVFVPGNHDLNDPPDDIPGINVDGRLEHVAGLTVAGLGGAGPTRFGFPYEWSEDQAAARLGSLDERCANGVDVFLSHTPPADSQLDVTARGVHVGSHAVGDWIARRRPRLFVCGHIHEAWGMLELDGVPCINAGALGEPYGQVIAWVVDWNDGPREIVSIREEEVAQPVRRAWLSTP